MEVIKSNELVGYEAALGFMEQRVAEIIEGSKPSCMWLLEHEALYTYGTSAKQEDLLTKDLPVFEAGRGGEFTYHGPGQRVAYVMMKLEPKDIRQYVWKLEEWVICTLARLGITGERRDGRIGIWVVAESGLEEKIAAIGVRVKKWVAYHGIALNLKPNMAHYDGIVPCGISEFGVTSLQKLGAEVEMAELDDILIEEFNEVFNNEDSAIAI